MRILILNTDYPEFLRWLYVQHPGLEKKSYLEQMQARVESLFGVADFYSRNLQKLGHEAYDIHVNNVFMQKAWAEEHDIPMKGLSTETMGYKEKLQKAKDAAKRTPLRYLKPFVKPFLQLRNNLPSWFHEILAKQIKYYKPDILLNQAMDGISSFFLKEMKPHVKLLVGQISSPIPEGEQWNNYDIVISSLPNHIQYFRHLGIPAELHRLGFEMEILSRLGENVHFIPVSFVGSFSKIHQVRIQLLEYLCSKQKISVWGNNLDNLRPNSPIRSCYQGTAWGINMYRILSASRITLNNHEEVQQSYANNMRLFEATGVGTLLLTDWKENLHEMFEPEKEVATYKNPEECFERIQYYLEHEEKRSAIAHAGQQRTLRDHTYQNRLNELFEIIKKYL